MQTIPVLQVTDNSICMYQEILDRKKRSDKQRDSESNLKDIQYNGFMSPKTKSKVRKYLSVWLNGVDQNNRYYHRRYKNKAIYPTFVTLTLPSKQIHKDLELKRKLLNNIIVWLRESKGVKHYYWRAEPQKNKNIHFHIICDRFIDHVELKQAWNTQISKLGYIDAYRKRMSKLTFPEYYALVKKYKNMTFDKAKSNFIKSTKQNWSQPNSTDIHRLSNIRSLSSYVIKYMTKTDSCRKIEGRIHGGSDTLKKLTAFNEIMGQDAYSLCAGLDNFKKAKMIEGEFHTIWYLDTFKFLFDNYKSYYYKIMSYYNSEFDRIYSLSNKAKILEAPPPTIVQKVKSKILSLPPEKITQYEIPFSYANQLDNFSINK